MSFTAPKEDRNGLCRAMVAVMREMADAPRGWVTCRYKMTPPSSLIGTTQYRITLRAPPGKKRRDITFLLRPRKGLFVLEFEMYPSPGERAFDSLHEAFGDLIRTTQKMERKGWTISAMVKEVFEIRKTGSFWHLWS